MVRRYAEPVTVGLRTSPAVPDSLAGLDQPDSSAAGAPEWFLWRGRHYAVHAVLTRWRERRAWWREALDPVIDAVDELATSRRPAIAVAARERLVWRVEAGPGWLRRAEHTGVFDLACDEGIADVRTGLPGSPDPNSWVLLRVCD